MAIWKEWPLLWRVVMFKHLMHLWTILRLLYFYKQSFHNSTFLWPIKMADYSNVHHWQSIKILECVEPNWDFCLFCGHSSFNKMNFCSKISCFPSNWYWYQCPGWIDIFPKMFFFLSAFVGFYYSIDASERIFVRTDKSYPYIIHYICAPKVSK